MYIYALIGMQFFANRMRFDPDTGAPVRFNLDLDSAYYNAEIPRSNFDSFTHALVTVFQVLTGENWNSVMYDARRATNGFACLYFLTLVIFGAFIVMNIFLAILLSNFEDFGKNEDEEEDTAGKDASSGGGGPGGAKVHMFDSNEPEDFDEGDDEEMADEHEEEDEHEDEHDKAAREHKEKMEEKKLREKDMAFGLLTRTCCFRRICIDMIERDHTWLGYLYSKFIFLTVSVSSVGVAFLNPLNDPGGRA